MRRKQSKRSFVNSRAATAVPFVLGCCSSFFAAVLSFVFITTAHADDVLKAHVVALSHDIGKRNPYYYQSLERAADYIASEFKHYGYASEEQSYTLQTRPSDKRSYRNIIATKPGTRTPEKIIIVCSHYDTYREAPGADDNASGTAAVLELARALHDVPLNKTVTFITFTNEELELVSEDSDMGSFRYAKQAQAQGKNIEAVICIDMIGFFSDKPGSQERPLLLKPFYPDTGNFIGIGSDIVSYQLLRTSVTAFKEACSIPVESLAIPAPLLPQLMTSDNRSFWAFGYGAIWITDTCIYRNKFMHTPGDTFEKLDYEKMACVVRGIRNIIVTLANAR